MRIDSALRNVTRLFLDTASVIYYVEKNPRYSATAEFVFDQIDNGAITGVTSVVTLAECLVALAQRGCNRISWT